MQSTEAWGCTSGYSDLIGLGWDLGIGIFESSSGGCKPRFGVTECLDPDICVDSVGRLYHFIFFHCTLEGRLNARRESRSIKRDVTRSYKTYQLIKIETK